MARQARDASGAAQRVALTLTPHQIERLDTLVRERGGTRSEVIGNLIVTAAGGAVGPPRQIDGQLSLVGPPADPAPVAPGGHVPPAVRERAVAVAARTAARRAAADPDHLDQCPHDSSTRSTITNLRRCDRCGAVQGVDGSWR